MQVNIDSETSKMLMARFGEDFVKKVEENLEVKVHETKKDMRRKKDHKERPRREKERK